MDCQPNGDRASSIVTKGSSNTKAEKLEITEKLVQAPREFPNESVADGYMLIWMGMLYTRELPQSV
jgi:hypothetical protein